MARKVLYLSYKRSASAIPTGNFVKGGIGITERARVQEYTRTGVIIELRNGRTGAIMFEGNYKQVCEYLHRLNESSGVRTFSDNTGYLDPNPPDDY